MIAVLWALWEAYRWIGQFAGTTWPFEVNDRTMPHIHKMLGQLFEPSRGNGPPLIDTLRAKFGKELVAERVPA